MTKSSPAGPTVDSTRPRSFQSIKMVGIDDLELIGVCASFALVFVADASRDGLEKCFEEHFCIIKVGSIQGKINIWRTF